MCDLLLKGVHNLMDVNPQRWRLFYQKCMVTFNTVYHLFYIVHIQ